MHLLLRRDAKSFGINSGNKPDNFKRIHVFGVKGSETVGEIKSLIPWIKNRNCLKIYLEFNKKGEE